MALPQAIRRCPGLGDRPDFASALRKFCQTDFVLVDIGSVVTASFLLCGGTPTGFERRESR